jgi:hypothetical protein
VVRGLVSTVAVAVFPQIPPTHLTHASLVSHDDAHTGGTKGPLLVGAWGKKISGSSNGVAMVHVVDP